MRQARLVSVLLAGLWCGLAGCRTSGPADTPQAVLERVRQACARKDAGAIRELVDHAYADDLGGPGRLEDDLRQLFSVYGGLDLHVDDLVLAGNRLSGFNQVRGRAFRFQGPLALEFVAGPVGPMIRSGLLTDLRAVTETLRQRRIGLERGSIERLDALISMEYKATDGDRQALIERLRESFAQTHDTALMVSDVGILVERDRAQVTQTYLMVTHVRDRLVERKDTERLILRKEGTRWRIFEGIG